MKFLILILSSLAVLGAAEAKSLKDYSPYEYDVRFTNPVCAEYRYKTPVQSRSGETLYSKPRNAYCTGADAVASAAQNTAPQAKLLEWINDPSTKEIFFTYLSYSNGAVTEALCKAIEKRDVKVTFVLDSGTNLDKANELLGCKPKLEANKPRLIIRGGTGGIGFAHNKIFIVNPSDLKSVRISFGSGNMTSGIVLHHENWHFITTSPASYFAQSHLCVMNAEIDHAESKQSFSDFMLSCLNKIASPKEDDIQSFFVPMDGNGKAAMKKITDTLKWAKQVKLAAHRFSNKDLIGGLSQGLEEKRFTVKLLFDDDIFWAGTTKAKRPNTASEFKNVLALEKIGAQPRYIETNDTALLLHHNKFIVFEDGTRQAAFVGAGNFTGDAFEKNLENFYFVTIPEIAATMSEQYDHLYFDLASEEENLPNVDAATVERARVQ